MTDQNEIAAKAWLRDRQGQGARYDAPTAPVHHLLLARRGTAYFARKLNEMTDAEFDAPSLVTGWRRRHVVANIGYQARKLARLVEAARKGASVECLTEPENINEDIEFGATLPVHALRYLFQHSQVHLNVEWRDLTDAGWETHVRSLAGELTPIASTPWMRAREIWLQAINLDWGGNVQEIPDELRQSCKPRSDRHSSGGSPTRE
ncbi:maleylpyruvate isomerase N-terminal domain-containing protein [Rhizobium sp. BR 318]|uniref:maleylpyruvate isomerase N-terminal domain-containing protein n=1 Tax=unclassified Rhizobium TaxID=2613769 RepID=UPI002F410372